MVELSYKQPHEFIKKMKHLKLENMTYLFGYEADPPISLDTGKSVSSTYYWSPMTFALVLNRSEVYEYITKHVTFNVKRLVEQEPLRM